VRFDELFYRHHGPVNRLTFYRVSKPSARYLQSAESSAYPAYTYRLRLEFLQPAFQIVDDKVALLRMRYGIAIVVLDCLSGGL
jgi:hypothetical protein